MNSKLIVGLQVGGFVLALAALIGHWPYALFVASFGVHVAGDVLLLLKEGLL